MWRARWACWTSILRKSSARAAEHPYRKWLSAGRIQLEDLHSGRKVEHNEADLLQKELLFGGYLYVHKAPDARAFHEETVRKLSKLYLYDCLRANKSLAAWGVEGRVPFLDKEFLDVAMRLNPVSKMCPGSIIEKRIVREAFADMLPEEIAWRQKEQFSDGVGYSWIDTLKRMTSEAASTRRHIEPWPASSSKTCFFPSVFVYLYEPEKSW